MNRTHHILVVDDHKEIRELVAQYLTNNGLKVTVVNGGTEMRQALRRDPINLVVLDIMMPGEDGLALCRQLRETSDLPVIMLTAMAGDADRVIGLELGLARIKAILRRVAQMDEHRFRPDLLRTG